MKGPIYMLVSRWDGLMLTCIVPILLELYQCGALILFALILFAILCCLLLCHSPLAPFYNQLESVSSVDTRCMLHTVYEHGKCYNLCVCRTCHTHRTGNYML